MHFTASVVTQDLSNEKNKCVNLTSNSCLLKGNCTRLKTVFIFIFNRWWIYVGIHPFTPPSPSVPLLSPLTHNQPLPSLKPPSNLLLPRLLNLLMVPRVWLRWWFLWHGGCVWETSGRCWNKCDFLKKKQTMLLSSQQGLAVVSQATANESLWARAVTGALVDLVSPQRGHSVGVCAPSLVHTCKLNGSARRRSAEWLAFRSRVQRKHRRGRDEVALRRDNAAASKQKSSLPKSSDDRWANKGRIWDVVELKDDDDDVA